MAGDKLQWVISLFERTPVYLRKDGMSARTLTFNMFNFVELPQFRSKVQQGYAVYNVLV